MAEFAVEGVLGTNILQDARAPGLWVTQAGGATTLLVESQGGQSLARFELAGGGLSTAGASPVDTARVGWSAAGQSWAVREETLDRLVPGIGQMVYAGNSALPGMAPTLLPLDLAGGRVYVAALPGVGTLYTLAPGSAGQLVQVHARGDTTGTYAGAPTALAGLEIGGTTFVAVASGGAESGLTLYRVSASGQLTATDSLGAAEGLGVHNPSALRVAEVDGTTLVILGAAGSGSLSVFAVSANGTLDPRSHLLDTLATRFGGVTVLETAEVAGRHYLVAGGADDGLSLFLILPSGQLVHLDTIADGPDSTLMNVSALELVALGNVLHVFATSESERGLTHLTVAFDPAGGVEGDGEMGEAPLAFGGGEDMQHIAQGDQLQRRDIHQRAVRPVGDGVEMHELARGQDQEQAQPVVGAAGDQVMPAGHLGGLQHRHPAKAGGECVEQVAARIERAIGRDREDRQRAAARRAEDHQRGAVDLGHPQRAGVVDAQALGRAEAVGGGELAAGRDPVERQPRLRPARGHRHKGGAADLEPGQRGGRPGIGAGGVAAGMDLDELAGAARRQGIKRAHPRQGGDIDPATGQVERQQGRRHPRQGGIASIDHLADAGHEPVQGLFAHRPALACGAPAHPRGIDRAGACGREPAAGQLEAGEALPALAFDQQCRGAARLRHPEAGRPRVLQYIGAQHPFDSKLRHLSHLSRYPGPGMPADPGGARAKAWRKGGERGRF